MVNVTGEATMSEPTHPLDEYFDFDTDDSMVEIEVPDDPNLDNIIKFALTDYVGIKQVIQLVEPKNRLKYYEMAERFLNQAKDALHKKGQLEIQAKRASASRGGKATKPSSQDQPEEKTGGIDRRDLAKKMQLVK